MARRAPWLRAEFFLGLLLLAGILYALFVEPFWLAVERPAFASERLQKALPGKKIAFISDLFLSGVGLRERKLIEEVERLNPDVVLIGGGFAPQSPEPLKTVLSALARGRSVYAVLSASDEQNPALRPLLEEAGVKLIPDRRIDLLGAVDLIGVGWPGALPRLLERPTERPAIVLGSTPEILNPIADGLLLEGPGFPGESAVEWVPIKGSYRFEQPPQIVISEGGPHRLRLQRAIAGLLIAEIRFNLQGGAPVIVRGEEIPSAALRGQMALLPGSGFGRQGTLLDVGGPPQPVTAALLAPQDYLEFSVDLPAGIYEIELLARTRSGQGAVWLELEGATSLEGTPRYRLSEGAAFPTPQSGIDLILVGGTRGGEVRPARFFERLFFPERHPQSYWDHLAGLFQINGTSLYVTRGIGTLGIPARVLARPELTVFEF